jgi:hypothetical protein
MTAARSKEEQMRSALRGALIARALELGIDPETVWCPSRHALAAWRNDGGLLRLDFNVWPAAELTR